jgi:hypothetical protein
MISTQGKRDLMFGMESEIPECSHFTVGNCVHCERYERFE